MKDCKHQRMLHNVMQSNIILLLGYKALLNTVENAWSVRHSAVVSASVHVAMNSKHSI